MTLSYRTRLFVANAAVITATLALVTLIVSQRQHRWLVDRSAETLERAARLVARDLSVDPQSGQGQWSELAHSLGQSFGARVTLIDSAGTVLGDTEVPPERLAEVENHANRPEIRRALAGRTGRAIRHSRTIGRDLLYVAISARTGPVRVVRLAEPLTELARLDASLLGLSIAAGGLTLLLSLIVAFWLTGRQIARVRDLEAVATVIGSGGPARARELPADELGRLGRALNQMAAELQLRLEALRRDRDDRERILAHMSDGVALLDVHGRILHMNQSLALLLEIHEPGGIELPFHQLVRSPELNGLIEQARASARTIEMELRLWNPPQRLVRATATSLGSGMEGGVLLVLRDLSEEERLTRMRQDFVANVSHELRTPLTSLRGYAETLLEGGLDDAERRREFVGIIRDQTVRLQALVNDLLSLAELERPGSQLRLEEFDLRELADAQASAFRSQAERAGLDLEVDRGAPLRVTADRKRLEQVLANLIDNALKYTDHGGIRVRLGGHDGIAWCEVEDTGQGIPLADQPRVFERFYRVDKARSREKGGTGLGLSIVKHIVALHGGTVTVRSAPGVGSTFRFEIPRRSMTRGLGV